MRSNETIIILQTIQILSSKVDNLLIEMKLLTEFVSEVQEGVRAWGEPSNLDTWLHPDAESDTHN